MKSFNVYGQTTETIGGNTPVWLGTVKPIPVGAAIRGGLRERRSFSAGRPCIYDAIDKSVTFDAVSKEEYNAYLYNDVVNDSDEFISEVTCAVVMHHPEGLLIDRVGIELSDEDIATLQKNIPGVLLVRG